jgi:hypothetical protein
VDAHPCPRACALLQRRLHRWLRELRVSACRRWCRQQWGVGSRRALPCVCTCPDSAVRGLALCLSC